MSETDTAAEPLEIPPEALSSEALAGVVESFVLREGTEYGAREYSLEEKCAQVLAQLKRGEARILYDPNTETVTLEATAGRARTRPG